MADTSVSKRKSCGECAKAKRKCGMETPRCQRCSKKNIECTYPNNGPPLSETYIPELDFPWLNDMMNVPGALPWSGALAEPSDPSGPQPLPDFLEGNDIPTVSTLARQEMEAAVRQFKTYPDKWLREGKAPFIHPRLYASNMPRALQDAYASCAIYATKTEENAFVAFSVIEAKANELLRSPNQCSWSPLDLLAAVQSLLIFQFIRLFDGDIRQRALAEQAEVVLESWTDQLNARTLTEQSLTTSTAASWRAWMFAESVRRTIIMSLFLRGIYALVKQGYCCLSDVITERSFTAQRQLWDANSSFQWDQARQLCSPLWVHKMQFDPILQGAKGTELDDFGIVIMITYKGRDRVDEWLLAANTERNLVADPDIYQNLRGQLLPVNI